MNGLLRLYLIVFLSSYTHTVLSKPVIKNQWFKFKSVEESNESIRNIRSVLLEASTVISKQTGHIIEIKESDYLLFGDSIIVNPDGTHYLYSYHPQRRKFSRLDKSEFHGHNFGRRLFAYKDEIYAIGGYGFWISHCKVIRFNRDSREWDLVHISGPLPLPSPGTTLIYEDTLYLFGTRKMGNSNDYKDPKLDYSVFWIDLKTWKSAERIFPAPIRETSHTQTINDQRSRYSVFASFGSVERVFDKFTGTLYYSYSGPSLYNGIDKKYHSYRDSILSFLLANNIIIFDKLGNERIISIPEYVKLYCNLECNLREIKNYNQPQTVKDNQNWHHWLWICGFALLISSIIFGVYYYRNSNGITPKLQAYYKALDNFKADYKELLRITEGDYTEKEIDLLLRIKHLPKIVRNVIRNKMLFEINAEFPNYIVKVPNQRNNSLFIYRISK